MAFYFARIWLTDSAAKLVLIAAVSVAKISAANTKYYNAAVRQVHIFHKLFHAPSRQARLRISVVCMTDCWQDWHEFGNSKTVLTDNILFYNGKKVQPEYTYPHNKTYSLGTECR